jgi:hypothetical protein
VANLRLIPGGRAAGWWLIGDEIHLLPLDETIPIGHRPIAETAIRVGPFDQLADVPDLEDRRYCDQCWREAYRRGVAPFGKRRP